MIAPSSTEANDTYTCILFKLASSLGDKDVIWDLSVFYYDLSNILQFSWTLHVLELDIFLGIIIDWLRIIPFLNVFDDSRHFFNPSQSVLNYIITN